jgi:hypothetical protein
MPSSSLERPSEKRYPSHRASSVSRGREYGRARLRRRSGKKPVATPSRHAGRLIESGCSGRPCDGAGKADLVLP